LTQNKDLTHLPILPSKMGKAFTKVKSPLRDYNLESRVHKILDSEKPSVAPRHAVPERFQQVLEEQQQQQQQSVAKAATAAAAEPPVATADMIRKMALEATEEELSDPASELLRKNDNLLERMDQLKITSQGDNPEIKAYTARRMPEDRTALQKSIYGQTEPEKIPIGRMSMKQVVEALVDYSRDREEFTASAISQSYRIDAEKAKNLTYYYQVFDIHLPKNAVEDHQSRTINASIYEETKKMLEER